MTIAEIACKFLGGFEATLGQARKGPSTQAAAPSCTMGG
eukprot:CAMPEP_0197875430 /NCGR_PEP_ID=MMETSP1439-20131203/4690_1 /TAXON_ID=66791 /ORGANISM="Gonyaulax spinifera, Strain CCMP409" /LENGTH=38 /DNA_ID= /DNA_START= /DNA_END= /DNA_ORIENTATION=